MRFHGERWGRHRNIDSPLISLVASELASRTGPCQETSKKTLMVIFAGDEEKDLLNGLMLLMKGCLRVVRVRNRGVLEYNENGGVESLSAIWWGKGKSDESGQVLFWCCSRR